MIPKQSHRPKSSHPPSRTPHKLARPAIPIEFRTKPQPSVGLSLPSSSPPSPTRKRETTRSSLPALPPPPQTRAPAGTQPSDPPNTFALTQITLVFPISQQGSQESVTSVESLLESAQRRRRNGLKSHRSNGLPAYYQSHKHIHEKRVCRFRLFPLSSSALETDILGSTKVWSKKVASSTERRCSKLYSRRGARKVPGCLVFCLSHHPVNSMATRVFFQLQGFRKCVPPVYDPKNQLNRLFVGLLRYEQHLERLNTVRSSLSRMLLSLSWFSCVITSTVSSKGLHVGLALQDQYIIEGPTPPFVNRISRECEYSE